MSCSELRGQSIWEMKHCTEHYYKWNKLSGNRSQSLPLNTIRVWWNCFTASEPVFVKKYFNIVLQYLLQFSKWSFHHRVSHQNSERFFPSEPHIWPTITFLTSLSQEHEVQSQSTVLCNFFQFPTFFIHLDKQKCEFLEGCISSVNIIKYSSS
jgi:hypothetical protein